MEWKEGDLVWFNPSIGHPLPGEIQEVHQAAQVIIVQALINGKVSNCFQIPFLLSQFLVFFILIVTETSFTCFIYGFIQCL